ncbi:MAG: hypothetical protein K6F61_04115 [Clostridiales bacterium]|nr:hypothetical protein [Clostridiales bacterium]
MSISNKAWFVDYASREWDHCYIVIRCDDRKEVKNILKRHLANFGVHDFKINRLAEYEGDHVPDDRPYIAEEDVKC